MYTTGRTFDEKGGNLIVESGIPDTTIGSLRAKGHIVNRGGYCGGYLSLLLNYEHGAVQGATESRNAGTVVGY